MKKIKLCLNILLVSLITSCSKDKTEAEKEIFPIELSKRIMCVDHIDTTDEADILSGNGDYKIIEVKLSRSANEEINKKLDKIPLENIFKIYVEDNKIIVERVLLEEFPIVASFILMDAEGVRKTCIAQNPSMEGIHDFND